MAGLQPHQAMNVSQVIHCGEMQNHAVIHPDCRAAEPEQEDFFFLVVRETEVFLLDLTVRMLCLMSLKVQEEVACHRLSFCISVPLPSVRCQ